jgi:hypothetical protein
MFFPLYKKTYTDNERRNIIQDNDHHTEGVMVVALTGLQNLNSIVQLNQGIKTSIRNLLLAIPAQGTTTGKLFLQVERQPTNDWLICCFPTVDAAKVTLRLSGLESSLKKYIKNEELEKLFKTPDFSLKFNGQAAPVRKGRLTRIVQAVPEATTAYTENAFKKLYTSRPKRLATEFDHASMTQQSELIPHSLHTVSPTTPSTADISHPNLTNRTSSSPRVIELEQGLKSTNDRLSRLENCCGMLAESTKNLEVQLTQINDTFSSKLQDMATAIKNLSPNRRNQKVSKPYDQPVMDLDL